MKAKTFSEKWDRKENVYNSHLLFGEKKRSWKKYSIWVLLGILFLIILFLLQKYL